MVEAAIFSALKVLGELMMHNAGFLQGVEEQIRWLKDELERMQCFLKDAPEKQSRSASIRKWVSDIREAAQDADDVIETLILKFDTPRSSIGRLINLPNHLYHLSMVGKEINSIKVKLEEIERSRVRYGIQSLGEMTESSTTRSEGGGGEVDWRRRLSPWQKDKHVVGLERDVELLLEKSILDGKKGLSVATIVGMGGIGKSTLAKKVYNDSAVAKRFDIRAWVVVSNECRPTDIIKELMPQLLETKEIKLTLTAVGTMENMSLSTARQMLHERLCVRRYFIVLDDLWDSRHWETLATIFPDEGRGSRLLLTSRNQDIAKHARYIHKIKLLDSDESWELLKKMAFIDTNDEYKCLEDLKNIGQEILKKCDGLPLAITMIGGLLLDKSPSTTKWAKVLREINSHLGTNESNVLKILDLSYRNLSPELKSCFLSLSLFKEDATIHARKLVQVWVAQGLIKHQESGEENTFEEVGRSYLDELINRNMVQVKNTSENESAKNCHIHDLIRELSIRKAKEETSLEIVREDADSQSLNKPRNRAIYCSSESFTRSTDKNKHLRALFFHGDGDTKFDVNPSYWKSFELLRILDFEDFKLEVVPDTISELTGLRYLGLRNTMIRNLPSSMGRLKKLEVLDIARTRHSLQVPNVLWEMDSMRHLYMHHHFICETPLRIDTMKNLCTLSYIKMDYLILEHLTHITSLRKLGISLFSRNDVDSHWRSSLENLVHITQLKLVGMLTKVPGVTYFPPNISCLTLVRTIIRQDPMPVLEKLPKLLCLKFKTYAYCGQEMVISNKGFPRLEVLILHTMEHLKNIRLLGIRGGIMPALKRLEIFKCPCLKQLPEKLRSVATFVDE